MERQNPVLAVALVGCGWFGLRATLPALLKLQKKSSKSPTSKAGHGKEEELRIRLAGICSRSSVNRSKALGKIDKSIRLSVKEYTSLREVLQDDTIHVVVLVLPIPAMRTAVQDCLAAGKAIISEKPFGPNISEAITLWKLYSHQASTKVPWCVCENWSHKPSVLRVHEILQSRVLGKVLRYRACLCQQIPDTECGGWRGQARDLYQGGWCLDVGVHMVRALRTWFGEATAKSGTLPLAVGADRPADSLYGDVEHEQGVQGVLDFRFVTTSESGSIPHEISNIVIIECSGGELRWQCEKSDIHLFCNEESATREVISTHCRGMIKRCKESTQGVQGAPLNSIFHVSEHIEGDGWVAGGVQSAMEDCLRQCASAMKLSRKGAGPRVHRTPAEEALKDACVIWDIMNSEEGAGQLSTQLEMSNSGVTCLLAPGYTIPDGSGTREGTPSRILRSGTIREIVAATRIAKETASNAVPVGSDQSWSHYGQTTGIRIETMLISRVIDIDVTRKEIRVQPGCSLRDINIALSFHGLCLPSLPALLDQTVGGAIGCGSHGSSLRFGTMSDFVQGLSLVSPTGEIHHLASSPSSAETDVSTGQGSQATNAAFSDDLLRAARLGLGRLGVVTEMVLRAHDAYEVRKAEAVMSLTEFSALAEAEGKGLHLWFDHVWAHFRIGSDSITVLGLQRRGAEKVPLPDIWQLGDYAEYDGRNWFPFEVPGVGGSAKVCADQDDVVKVSMQYAIPLGKLSGLLVGVHALPEFQGRLAEVKFVGKNSSTILGPNVEGPVACLNIFWEVGVEQDPRVFLQPLEMVLSKAGGKQHWGKFHTQQFSVSVNDQFLAIQKKLDTGIGLPT